MNKFISCSVEDEVFAAEGFYSKIDGGLVFTTFDTDLIKLFRKACDSKKDIAKLRFEKTDNGRMTFLGPHMITNIDKENNGKAEIRMKEKIKRIY